MYSVVFDVEAFTETNSLPSFVLVTAKRDSWYA